MEEQLDLIDYINNLEKENEMNKYEVVVDFSGNFRGWHATIVEANNETEAKEIAEKELNILGYDDYIVDLEIVDRHISTIEIEK